MDAKSPLDELAIFGGPPAFAEKLHVGRPNIGDRQKFRERVDDILDRKWLTNGGRYVLYLLRTDVRKLHRQLFGNLFVNCSRNANTTGRR